MNRSRRVLRPLTHTAPRSFGKGLGSSRRHAIHTRAIPGSFDFVSLGEFMRSFFVAAAWLSGTWLCGCGSTSNGVTPSLTITPSGNAGTVAITSPTNFTAQLVGSTAEVAWTVSGGTLSGTSGLHVVYIPPPGTAMGTLTATAGNLTASVMISSSPVALRPVSIPGLQGAVTVQYDAQDVPHIQCSQAVDCVAVQGYLQARDRWFPMDFLRHVAEGRLAELIGVDGLSQDVSLRTIFTTRAGP